MKVTLKRIDPLTTAKLEALLMGIFGLIIGFVYGIFGAAFGAIGGSALIGAGIGIAAIILLPIMYAVIGFLAGLIGAALYNLVAGWIGGIKMEFSDK
jgi:hypothetical protein